MSRQQRMVAAFAEYEHAVRDLPPTANIIGIQPGTRLYRIVRTNSGWRVWVATRDFIHGSYIELHNDGSAYKWECRPDEGDECFTIRWDDAEVATRDAQRRFSIVANDPTTRGPDTNEDTNEYKP